MSNARICATGMRIECQMPSIPSLSVSDILRTYILSTVWRALDTYVTTSPFLADPTHCGLPSRSCARHELLAIRELHARVLLHAHLLTVDRVVDVLVPIARALLHVPPCRALTSKGAQDEARPRRSCSLPFSSLALLRAK